MAKRPIERKRARRVMRALSRKPLPAYINLIEWLTDRSAVSTRKEARELILAGRVKSESHTLGVVEQPFLGPDGQVETRKVVAPLVPADLRATLRVVEA